jgi:hypothetical protein
MNGQNAGDQLAHLLLPYRVREHDDAEDPEHETAVVSMGAPHHHFAGQTAMATDGHRRCAPTPVHNLYRACRRGP